MTKLIFVDTESTGVDPSRHALHQVNLIVQKDFSPRVHRLDLKLKPWEGCEYHPEALQKCNKTIEELQTYPEQHLQFEVFLDFLSEHVNKFEKKDKLFFLGYNSPFDSGMIRKWFELNGDDYYGSWFWNPPIDIMALAAQKLIHRRPYMDNFKLDTVAREFGIHPEGELHEAGTDNELARKVYYKVC